MRLIRNAALAQSVLALNGRDDREAEVRARAAGLSAPALSAYFAGSPTREGLLLGYAGFDEETIDDAIARLARGLR